MMTKKFLTFFLVSLLSVSLVLPGVYCEAKGGGSRSTSGFSRSSAPKASAPKASAPKSNTSGFSKKSSSSSSSAGPKGSSYTAKGGGKVTSAGGNTSGFKSKQTQTKEKAEKNMAKKDSGSNSSNHWYGGTNNHYYNSGYDGGFGHFATGMLYGSLLSSPWHVYAGAPGYVGAYGPAPGVATGGFYSPFSGFIGLIIWVIEWILILTILYFSYRFFKKWYNNRKKKENTNGFSRY